MISNCVIEKADTPEKYEALRDLWCRVFGDEPAFTDYVYRTFGSDATGYVLLQDDTAVSALTCYRCGELTVPGVAGEEGNSGGRPVYVSYAVCTDPEFRGLGHAGRLTRYVKDLVTAGGGISLVSPAEESLTAFYRDAGYAETCFVSERCIGPEDDEEYYADETLQDPGSVSIWGLDRDGNPGFIEDTEDAAGVFETEISIEHVSPSVYNERREAFLKDVAHVSLSPAMLELVRAESAGGDGLLVVNGGDALCVISAPDPEDYPDTLLAAELIVNPELKAFSEEIDDEIAAGIAAHFGYDRIRIRTPEAGHCQSMSAGTDCADFYFGFPVE